jgi:dipeptidyl-peptidase 4
MNSLKKITCLALAAISLQSLHAQSSRSFTLEEIWASPAFAPKLISGLRSMSDGKHYTSLHSSGGKSMVLRYDYVSGQLTDTVFHPDWATGPLAEKAAVFSGYVLSPDEKQVLLITESEPIYRRSSKENCYIYNRATHSLSPLSGNGKQQNATFSPDGSRVAFFRDNNLFIKDLASGAETQITRDGKLNAIINGHADWVYEEEFEIEQAFYWSPDSKKIAFYRFDESRVKEFSMAMYSGGLYPAEYRYKYPKAGEENSSVDILVYDLNKGSAVKVDVGAERDQYIPRVQWTEKPGILAIQRMNRLQNRLELLFADESGATKVIYKEESPSYIDISNDLTFLKNQERFVFSSSKSGFNHLYLFDMSGKELKQLTSGPWEVTKLYGVDEKSGKIFFQSAEESPLERYVYSIGLDGKGKKKLTSLKGTNDVVFSADYSSFINTWSDANTPYAFTLHASDGRLIKVLEENKELVRKLQGYTYSPKQFFTFRTSEGVSLNGWMIKPADFDSSKKYPVFMFVYGGPGSQTVNNSWDSRNGLWYQLLAQKGYIVVSVDNRGTGARGDEFKKCTYRNLGGLETTDQIEAARYLGSLKYVDPARIGIQGWSYGGYMTSLCMTKGADVFRAGIAVAPVTNWKFYDSIYTERYMQTPKDNDRGYEDNSPVNFADRLKGKFLLVHGTADDNVHMQNSMEFVTRLVKAGKQFDLFYYPNKNHGISGGNARLHLYTRMTDFILSNL